MFCHRAGRTASLATGLLGTAAILALAACSDSEAPASSAVPVASEVGTEAAQPTPSEQLLAMADRHARRYLAAHPQAATSLGVSEAVGGAGYNSRLDAYGTEGSLQAVALNERFLEALRRFDRRELEGTALITFDVLRNAYELAAQRNSFEFGQMSAIGSSNPYVIDQLSGPQIDVPQMLLTRQPLASPADVDAYLARLAEFGPVIDETAAAVSADANAGVIPPVFVLEKLATSLETFTAAAASDHVLVTHLRDRMDGMAGRTAAEREARLGDAVRLVRDVVYPAYRGLAETVDGLIEQTDNDAGIWRLEQGEDFYQHALDSYGGGGRSAAEIHQIGLDEVARIEAEMDVVLQALGLTKGTVGARFASIAEDPAMVYPNTDAGREELMQALRDQVDAIMALAPDWFGTLPPQPLEVRRIPDYEQDSAPGGYYTDPSLDGSRPGIYWINLKNTADWPKQTLKTLTYHEAVPGHHFQVALQMDISDFPLIRNTFYHSEYAEGWALYAEQVAAEMGMYENDPYGDLGRLQSELFRAVRLVVDTGMHDKRWSREQAIDYMVDHLGDTRESVTREVERYAVWPGQATSYKLGMLKFVELRERAEEALGEDFDIRQFHDAVLLGGDMPLPVLERHVDAWIAAQRQAG